MIHGKHPDPARACSRHPERACSRGALGAISSRARYPAGSVRHHAGRAACWCVVSCAAGEQAWPSCAWARAGTSANLLGIFAVSRQATGIAAPRRDLVAEFARLAGATAESRIRCVRRAVPIPADRNGPTQPPADATAGALSIYHENKLHCARALSYVKFDAFAPAALRTVAALRGPCAACRQRCRAGGAAGHGEVGESGPRCRQGHGKHESREQKSGAVTGDSLRVRAGGRARSANARRMPR